MACNFMHSTIPFHSTIQVHYSTSLKLTANKFVVEARLVSATMTSAVISASCFHANNHELFNPKVQV